MSDKLIVLSNSFLEVGIAPECGASVAYFRTKGEKLFDILRPASSTAIQKRDPNGMAMFPMLPYTHRIKDGKFTYWGITRFVAPNQAGVPDPLHGDGWKNKWTVEKASDTELQLSMSHNKEQKGYPFSYTAQLTYRLNEKTLSVEIKLTNTAVLPMPCGMGLHPYFPKTPNVTLTFNSKNVWYHENDPIDRPYHTPEEWSFKNPKELKDATFDTCFGGFDGTARIDWPKFGMGVEIKADEKFGHLVLYSPYHKNFFCLEPTTMANNAFNLASEGIIGTGIQSIGQNETLAGEMSFTVLGI